MIVLENVLPIQAKKVRYFADAKFMDRLKEISPSLSAIGGRLPNKKEMDEAMRAGELAAPVPQLSITEYQDVIASAEGSIEQVSSSSNLHRAFIPDDYPRISEINFSLDLSNIKPPPEGERTIEKLHEFADKISREQGFLI